MPQISVIVPVYNLEEYLPKCIDSILGQTYQDFELILVDDGSTDQSGAICDRYQERFSDRIRVVHGENKGAGGARNTGIEQARGFYLCFVDGDDYIAPDALGSIWSAADEMAADIVLYGMKVVDETGRVLRVEQDELPSLTPLSLKTHPELLFALPRMCSKFCRRSLFLTSGLRFPERVWYEDFRLATKILPAAGTIVSLPETPYYYLQRSGSTMQNKNIGRNREILEAFEDICESFRQRGLLERCRDEIEFLAVFHLYIAASVRVINIDRANPLVSQFRSYLTDAFPSYRDNRYLSTLDPNKLLIYKLLEKKRYAAVELLFRIKKVLRR